MPGAVYLTGVPGTGKSTALEALGTSAELDLAVYSYSDHLGARLGRTREELRAESSATVSKSAVAAVDREVGEFVDQPRTTSLVVIDSHAVTDETFGQRVIPFHPRVLASLELDAIVCLTAEPAIIASRVAADSQGRPKRTVAQIDRAQNLQLAVAVSYAAQLGVPLFVVEVDGSPGEVQAALERVFVRATRGRPREECSTSWEDAIKVLSLKADELPPPGSHLHL